MKNNTGKECLIVRDAEILEMLEISRMTLWRLTKNDNFPKQVFRGGRSRKAVYEWLAERNLM